MGVKGLVAVAAALAMAGAAGAANLWQLAKSKKQVHQFSTLFTAQDVRDRLASGQQIAAAIDWCQRTGITKVYIESFRDGYQADREALVRARDRFRKAGFEVSGCVTPTRVGKPSTGWKPTISCYTDFPTQKRIRSIFEFTAALFDEIMIDDFWFTDCTCEQCDAARRAQQVSIEGQTYPVAGQTWSDYRSELMYRMSSDEVLDAARKVNRKVKIIVKYPQWYDRFHERGYNVARETELFDKIWVGTETRDLDQNGAQPYEAYFIMRWLGGIGGRKTGGGWYDSIRTSPPTYLEQARQTVLAGARESMLFCYGGLQRGSGPADVEALRAHIPELLDVAGKIRRKIPVGIAAYKPENSNPENESYIFDYAGMLGLPLAPTHEFPEYAPAAFFPLHSLKDPDFLTRLALYIGTGSPVLLSDGLAQAIQDRQILLKSPNVHVLALPNGPKSLLALSEEQVNALRTAMLKPFEVSFRAPNRVGLYLFKDGSYVVENFNDTDIKAELNGTALKVPARGWVWHWK